MAYDHDPEAKDPDIGGMKWFLGALAAIVLVMTGIYFFASMDAIHVASNSTVPPVATSAPEPSTPPPSTLSR